MAPMKFALFLLAATLAFAQQPRLGNAGFVPNPSYDTEPPQLPDTLKNGGVLIFSASLPGAPLRLVGPSAPVLSLRTGRGLG